MSLFIKELPHASRPVNIGSEVDKLREDNARLRAALETITKLVEPIEALERNMYVAGHCGGGGSLYDWHSSWSLRIEAYDGKLMHDAIMRPAQQVRVEHFRKIANWWRAQH